MEAKDVNKDIKNITREAGYLLEQLSAGRDEQEPVAVERLKALGEAILASESQSDAKVSPEKSDQSIHAEPRNLGVVVGSLAGLLFLAALIIPLVNQSGTSKIDSPSALSDDVAGLTKLESDGKNAVLICEHRPIIEMANSLSLSNQPLVARKNKIVSDANKSIAFLDASSAKGYKYEENPGCTWGVQWFDKHSQNSFRAFVALSKKCINPKLYYEYSRDKEGKDLISKGSLSLSSHRIGEITIPYFAEGLHCVSIRNVTCS